MFDSSRNLLPGCTRRLLLKSLLACTLVGAQAASAAARGKTGSKRYDKEEWMAAWMSDAARTSDSPLHLGRFNEPIYYLLDPISWEPNGPQATNLKAVTVPKGFVSDLASIPRIFWSALRPDGTYAYAAIIHDYLYWTQTIPRESADEILKSSMEDFEVEPFTVQAIYRAVRVGGGSAWSQNAKAKAGGQRRVLAEFPPTARTRWSDWRKDNSVFASE